MDIHLETTYYNCSFSLVDVKSNEQGIFECTLNFNAGWLSCKRPFTFTRKNGEKFVNIIKKINKPFKIIAILENTSKNMKIQMECTAPGNIMVSAEGFDDSEFSQEARLGFNINKAKLNKFVGQMDALFA
jgi:hypothetical protein